MRLTLSVFLLRCPYLSLAEFLRAHVHGQDVGAVRQGCRQLREEPGGLRDRHLHVAGGDPCSLLRPKLSLWRRSSIIAIEQLPNYVILRGVQCRRFRRGRIGNTAGCPYVKTAV